MPNMTRLAWPAYCFLMLTTASRYEQPSGGREKATVSGDCFRTTGTLADVRAIAGYVLDRAGRRQAAVMIVNHPNAPLAQPALDALLGWVYEAPGDGAAAGEPKAPRGRGPSTMRRRGASPRGP